jgi:DNA-binding NarL/FixJ family response regulator
MPLHAPITVVLGQFDDLLAGGLRELVEGDSSLTVVAADVEQRRIPVVLRAHRPDVAILAVAAFAKLAEVRKLREGQPATSLVLLSREPSMEENAQLLAFGASACLGVDTQSRDVLNAIHLASRGLQIVPRAASKGSDRSHGEGHLLTRREAEVLPLLQQGRSNAQIAVALQVGVETIRTHARNIYRKLGVDSRRQLAPVPAPASTSPGYPAHPPRRRISGVPVGERGGHSLGRR